jgi:type II secretory pathway pseudopilin PulG
MRDERGETLVETLMTVAILGIAVLGLIGGLVMAVRASDQHHKEADGNAVLTAAAESVVDNNRNPYQTCAHPLDPTGQNPDPTAHYYDPTRGVATPAGWPPLGTVVKVTEVDFVNPVTGQLLLPWTQPTVIPPTTCPETTPPSGIPTHVAQQITIQVTDNSGRTQQITVGKSG